MSKKIHLVLTVGKNPLPVWVAWDRLTNHWESQGHEVAVQFVYTPGIVGSENEKKRLKQCCVNAGVTVRGDIQTDARNPDRTFIEQGIRNAMLPDFTDLHVHYTGGTQAMGVATVYAMTEVQRNLLGEQREIDVDASYLDPGRGALTTSTSPPAIVSWNHDPLIQDTRVGIAPDLTQIANLNGFRTGPFRSQDKPYDCPAPSPPNNLRLKAGAVVLDNYRGPVEQEFRNNFPKERSGIWWATFHPHNDDFVHTHTCRNLLLNANQSQWENEILPAVNAAYPFCQWNCVTKTLNYPGNRAASPSQGGTLNSQKDDLEEMDKFFTGHWLEYAAYAAFKDTLENIKNGNSQREFDLYHNVYVAQQGTGIANRHFELDIVAVLGYQVVVVSCSLTSNKSDVKQKAMEVYHRAKQLGGDEARAVVLCVADANDTGQVEKELEDETGTRRPLQIWGRQIPRRGGRGPVPDMADLRSKFDGLCRGYLHWN